MGDSSDSPHTRENCTSHRMSIFTTTLPPRMASLKDSRVVIASLFLPQGTVYYDDDPSPRHEAADNQLSHLTSRPIGGGKPLLGSAGFSIVDDLTKVTTPALSFRLRLIFGPLGLDSCRVPYRRQSQSVFRFHISSIRSSTWSPPTPFTTSDAQLGPRCCHPRQIHQPQQRRGCSSCTPRESEDTSSSIPSSFPLL